MWINQFILGKYYELKLKQNIHYGKMGYHITNKVAPKEDIESEIDSLAMDTTANQGHVNQFMATIHQVTETNQILGKHIKYISAMNYILIKQNQGGKNNQKKMKKKIKVISRY